MMQLRHTGYGLEAPGAICPFSLAIALVLIPGTSCLSALLIVWQLLLLLGRQGAGFLQGPKQVLPAACVLLLGGRGMGSAAVPHVISSSSTGYVNID